MVEADIKGFFDNVNHEQLMRLLEHRVADPRLLWLVRRFLKAGVMEEGAFSETDSGTSQGGLASPVLANIYRTTCWMGGARGALPRPVAATR